MAELVKFYVARNSKGYYLMSPTSASGILVKNALMTSRDSAVARLHTYYKDGYVSEVVAVELTPLTDVQQKVLDDMKECRLEGTNPVEVITVFSQQIQGGYSGYEITNTEFVEVVKRFTFWIDERRS